MTLKNRTRRSQVCNKRGVAAPGPRCWLAGEGTQQAGHSLGELSTLGLQLMGHVAPQSTLLMASTTYVQPLEMTSNSARGTGNG